MSCFINNTVYWCISWGCKGGRNHAKPFSSSVCSSLCFNVTYLNYDTHTILHVASIQAPVMPEPRKNEGGFVSGVLLKVAELEGARAVLPPTGSGTLPPALLPLSVLGERASLSLLPCPCHFVLGSYTPRPRGYGRGCPESST